MRAKAGRAVVLSRPNKRATWDVSYIVESKRGKSLEEAWVLAHGIEEQERHLGHKTQCIVVLEADYDAGNMRVRRPPRNFDFKAPEAVSAPAQPPPGPHVELDVTQEAEDVTPGNHEIEAVDLAM